MTNQKQRDAKFVADINSHMENIVNACYRKVVADRGQDWDDPKFSLVHFKVTKRQVAESLDHLPTSIRSSMVIRIQSGLNAIHEP